MKLLKLYSYLVAMDSGVMIQLFSLNFLIDLSTFKVIVFNSNGQSYMDYFKLENYTLETIKSFCYLGVTIRCNSNYMLHPLY